VTSFPSHDGIPLPSLDERAGHLSRGSGLQVLLLEGLHQDFDLSDGFGWVQTLRARGRAVHDGVTLVDREGILHPGHALRLVVIPAVNHPTVGLHQDGRPQVLVSVPPVAGTRGAATSAQDALVQAIQLSPVLDRLNVLLLAVFHFLLAFQIRLNGAILGVEIGHVRDQILNDVHVG